MPIEAELLLFLSEIVFFTILLGAWQIHTSHIIYVSEIPMLTMVYHHYEVSGEINSLYLLHFILLLLLCIYIKFQLQKKKKSNIFSQLD
jgi:hypothetical protein